MEFGLGREGTIVASNPLRTGNEGVEPIVYSKPRRPARRSKRAGILTDQRECACANCRRQGGRLFPRHYVGRPALAASSLAYLAAIRDLVETAAAEREKKTGKDGDVYVSYECYREQQPIDPELEEELQQLRNDAERQGAFVVDRYGEFQ